MKPTEEVLRGSRLAQVLFGLDLQVCRSTDWECGENGHC